MRVATNRQFATQNLRHRGEDSGGEAPATLRCKLEQVMAGGQMGHGAIGAISIKIRKAVRLPVRQLVLFSGGVSLRLVATPPPPAVAEDVSVAYLPRNVAPEVLSITSLPIGVGLQQVVQVTI